MWDGFVGALIGAFAGLTGAWSVFRTSQRRIEAQHVIAERAVWREKLRDALRRLDNGDESTARDVAILLELNTNPIDPQDVALVALARSIRFPASQQEQVDELVTRVALLLKHDWERAKREAGVEADDERIEYEQLASRREEQVRLTASPRVASIDEGLI